jgi:queuine tRNA-ribosyltransferase
MQYDLITSDHAARRGRLSFERGTVETPAFMPVGTYGTVKAMTPEELTELGAQIILGNTFHLMLRPGTDIIRKHGDLHDFMHWDGPILTDSGGFQVFSLAKMRKITEQGVVFQSPIDGARIELTPELSMQVQRDLGSDIVMIFDECTPYPATREQADASMQLSLRWAERSKRAHEGNASALFGIVQGGMYEELREVSANGLTTIGFDGYAIGGLSVGEPEDERNHIIERVAPLLPESRPRYLMGVGKPEDIVEAVRRGIDMFDCVIPTRFARSGAVFTKRGRIRLTHRRYRRDAYPIDTSCSCASCTGGFSRAYLHHLFAANEVLSAILASIHNVHFYERLMSDARAAILAGRFAAWRREFLAEYAPEAPAS